MSLKLTPAASAAISFASRSACFVSDGTDGEGSGGGALVRLKAPPGTDEANVGEIRYPVADDGTIQVPAEAVDDLVKVGGFVVVAEEVEDEKAAAKGKAAKAKTADAPAADGLVPVKHPEGVGCSYGGQNYEAAKSGIVRVPAAAVEDLRAHGFEPAQ